MKKMYMAINLHTGKTAPLEETRPRANAHIPFEKDTNDEWTVKEIEVPSVRRSFTIPKSFKLMGRTIDVELCERMMSENGLLGTAVYDKGLIKLQASSIKRDQQEQIFLHEAVHHWLKAMGKDGLCSDEAFVDMLASLIHQYLVTQEGDIRESG